MRVKIKDIDLDIDEHEGKLLLKLIAGGGGRLLADLGEFENWLRAQEKYGNFEPVVGEKVAEIRSKFYEFCSESLNFLEN